MKHTLLSLLLLLSGPCMAQASIEEVLQQIESNNLELKALAADHEAALLELKGENLPSGPSVEYSPFYTKGYHGMASSELIVSQEFDFPTQYVLRNRQQRLETDVREESYQVRRRAILLEARQLCYEVIAQNQLIALQEERLEKCRKTTELLQKRLDAGDANALEVNKARLERMQAAQELVQQRNVQEDLLQQLRVLNAEQPIQLALQEFPEVDASATLPASAALPEVAEAQRALVASLHNENLSRRAWLPSLRVGYRRNTEEASKLNGFLVGASFPLFGNSARMKAAQKRTQQAELRLAEVSAEMEGLQRNTQQKLNQLRSVMDHTDTELLRQTLPLLEKALQHGEINALQYYNECNSIYDKLMAHIALHRDYLVLYASLYLR